MLKIIKISLLESKFAYQSISRRSARKLFLSCSRRPARIAFVWNKRKKTTSVDSTCRTVPERRLRRVERKTGIHVYTRCPTEEPAGDDATIPVHVPAGSRLQIPHSLYSSASAQRRRVCTEETSVALVSSWQWSRPTLRQWRNEKWKEKKSKKKEATRYKLRSLFLETTVKTHVSFTR